MRHILESHRRPRLVVDRIKSLLLGVTWREWAVLAICTVVWGGLALAAVLFAVGVLEPTVCLFSVFC